MYRIYMYRINSVENDLKMRNISSFISGDNFNKHRKQDQKGRGRGASRDREKGQETSTAGRGKPSGT